VSNRDGTRFWGRTQRIRFPVFLETFNTIDWVEPSDTLLANDRYLREPVAHSVVAQLNQ